MASQHRPPCRSAAQARFAPRRTQHVRALQCNCHPCDAVAAAAHPVKPGQTPSTQPSTHIGQQRAQRKQRLAQLNQQVDGNWTAAERRSVNDVSGSVGALRQPPEKPHALGLLRRGSVSAALLPRMQHARRHSMKPLWQLAPQQDPWQAHATDPKATVRGSFATPHFVPERVVPLAVFGHVHQHRRQANQGAVAQHQPHLRDRKQRNGEAAKRIGSPARATPWTGRARSTATELGFASRQMFKWWQQSMVCRQQPASSTQTSPPLPHLPGGSLERRRPLVHILVRQRHRLTLRMKVFTAVGSPAVPLHVANYRHAVQGTQNAAPTRVPQRCQGTAQQRMQQEGRRLLSVN